MSQIPSKTEIGRPPVAMTTVVVSGAGIAGLALAIALSRQLKEKGMKILVVEKDTAYRVSSAGIHLKASGLAVLHEDLGINDIAVMGSLCESVRLVSHCDHGVSLEGTFAANKTNSSFVVARSVVHQRLLEASRKCGNVEVRMGVEIVGLKRGQVH